MKLLLDAMFSDRIADQLRQRGHDVLAATERSDLLKLPDPDLFAAAQAEQRAVVTNDVTDFIALDRLYRQQGRAHYGLIFTSDRRFHRSREGIGQLVLALDVFLDTASAAARATSLVHWLQ